PSTLTHNQRDDRRGDRFVPWQRSKRSYAPGENCRSLMNRADEVRHEQPNSFASTAGACQRALAVALPAPRAPTSSTRWLFISVAVSVLACSSDPAGSPPGSGGKGGASATTGGSTSTAGMSASTGGSANPTSGGSGGLSSGGSVGSAGSNSSGGTSSGGSSSGGSSSGGSSSGGTHTGGAASGGSGPGTAGSGSGGSPSVTCPATVLKPGNSDKTLSVGGSNRSYTLHVPSTYDGSKAVPLILDFHGLGGNGKSE